MWFATPADAAAPPSLNGARTSLSASGRSTLCLSPSHPRAVRAARSGGQDVRAPIMLFVSLRVCDKSLRHETTTTIFVSADFGARSVCLCFGTAGWRAKHDASPEKACTEDA